MLEDEGHMIGANHLPECLRLRMTQSPLAVVEDPFDVRLERLREEYFDRMYRDFIAAYGEEKGWQAYGEYLHHGLFAIRRRLGLQRFAQLTERLDEALAQQQRTARTEAHFAWLVPLLEEYYDPMYRYQLGKKAGKILFRGSWQGGRRLAGEVIACSIVPACGVNALAGLPLGAICSPGSAARPGSCDRLEVVAQTHQVHIPQVVGAGGKHVFVVNAETVIQLEADPQTVIDTLVVAAIHVLQAVAHKVRLNRFNSVLIDREFIARKIFNPPGVAGEVVMHIGFLVVRKF